MAGYAGAWRKATLDQQYSTVPLQQQTDPEHSRPTDGGADSDYVDRVGAPTLPSQWVDGEYEQGNVPSRYVDRTPQDPEFGVGDLPGLDYSEARAIAGVAHQLDFGADAARGYRNPGRREGTYEVLRIENQPEHPYNPTTDEIRSEIGHGSPWDADARGNIRIQRWRDRYIDMHWWGTEWRALAPKYSPNVTDLPVVPNGNQTVSPYQGNLVTDPMNWQTPQERRTPREWDTGSVVDGSDQALQEQQFGLTTWGL